MHKVNKQQYALKYFSKNDLIQRKMSKNIVRERNILVKLSHPFICNLKFGFQDDYNIYMALDLMLGGDLRFHTTRRKFSNEELIFIAAEISSALGYLHSLGIVHRFDCLIVGLTFLGISSRIMSYWMRRVTLF